MVNLWSEGHKLDMVIRMLCDMDGINLQGRGLEGLRNTLGGVLDAMDVAEEAWKATDLHAASPHPRLQPPCSQGQARRSRMRARLWRASRHRDDEASAPAPPRLPGGILTQAGGMSGAGGGVNLSAEPAEDRMRTSLCDFR